MPHWGLSRDPFAEFDSAYVSLPSHDEAVACLVFAIETAQRHVVLEASAGLGKTTVLRRAILQAQGPRRRIASVSRPCDGTLTCALLAERLGQRPGQNPGRLAAWRSLERAVRLASLQGLQVVLAIDDCAGPNHGADRRDLDSLAQFGSKSLAGLTIIQLERTEIDGQSRAHEPWTMTAVLESLTRSQAERYLAAKLAGAGSSDRMFTPRAITRLHGLTMGSPRGLERLATRCLMKGAVRGLEVITPETVDSVSGEHWLVGPRRLQG